MHFALGITKKTICIYDTCKEWNGSYTYKSKHNFFFVKYIKKGWNIRHPSFALSQNSQVLT
jgi:hypothetical protein